MIILCTHNDGGVGKTTLAVHIAGVLISQYSKTLLIDCDDQADFWQFYTGREPGKLDKLDIDNNRTILHNPERKSIKSLAKPQQYDHVVLDIDTPLRNTVQVIVGDDPNLILVPVNKSQKTKALRNLPRTLKVISQLSKPGFSSKVVIVPLGIQTDAISQVIEKIDENDKPTGCKIAEEMPDLQDQMQMAIYDERKYIWDYKDCEAFYDYFSKIIAT